MCVSVSKRLLMFAILIMRIQLSVGILRFSLFLRFVVLFCSFSSNRIGTQFNLSEQFRELRILFVSLFVLVLLYSLFTLIVRFDVCGNASFMLLYCIYSYYRTLVHIRK